MTVPWTRLVRCADSPRACIVLVAGLAGLSDDWDDVLPLLPGDVDVVMIEPTRCPDRPSLPQRTAMMAVAVETAFTDIADRGQHHGLGPVVWVAHSLAAFAVEALVLTGRTRCDAVVMIDPSVGEEAPKSLGRNGAGDLPAGGLWLARTLAAHQNQLEPVTRHLGPLGRRLMVRAMTRRADPRPARQVRSLYGDPANLATAIHELDHFSLQARTLDRLRAHLPRPPLPWVTLLAGRRSYPYRPGLGETVRTIDGTGHLIMVERPEAVAEAINEVLDAALAR